MKIVRITFQKNKEFIKYLIIGGFTTIISIGVYDLCVITFFSPESMIQLQAANVISWAAAVVFAYFANRVFVFESKNREIWKEAINFCGCRLLTLWIDMLSMFVMVSGLKWNDKAAKMLVQVVIVLLNYILGKYHVFKDESR